MREINVCAGIGDNIWLLQKLIHAQEKFIFNLPNGQPQRGKQIFDLLPQVAARARYVDGLNYERIKRNNVTRIWPQWKQIRVSRFYLECNLHLEEGRRIESFLPDLPTSFTLPWVTTPEEQAVAKELLPGENYIGIYASAYSTTRAWNFWDEHAWLEFIQRFYHKALGTTFVIIGAKWDLDLADNLVQLLRMHCIPHVNTIGQPLAVVVEILRRLNYFVGFPSGLSILNETLGKETFMFYPVHLAAMMHAWADPARITEGKYLASLFCTPEEAMEKIFKNKKL